MTSPPPPAPYGWTPVPRSLPKFLETTKASSSKPIPIPSIPHPTDPISTQTLTYATTHLPRRTLNHSLRVYAFGHTILQNHFPHFLDEEAYPYFVQTFYLACLLHDIGTAEEHFLVSKMSFDFLGAVVAMGVLRGVGAGRDLGEGVGEAVLRHQDLGTTGAITGVGGLVQVCTVFDNAGLYAHLVHRDTVEAVTSAWPREKWTACFADTIRREVAAKPWCHSTHIEGFAEMVEGNVVMREWD